MPSPQNTPFSRRKPGTCLDSALDDYLLAKSKANETGNYRRNAERVLREFLDWAKEQDGETSTHSMPPISKTTRYHSTGIDF